ncbi:MAG: hypothetical protein IKT54_02605 [Clostridia bacterium]|nr:hypothetical protein [Clostridia bacterium]
MKENTDIKKENKKKLITTAVAAALLLVVLIALNSIDFDSIDVDALIGNIDDETEKIYFSEPDFEENIFDDAAYMDKNRFISYTEAPFTTLLTEKFNDYGEMGEFWLDYFNSIINGDFETYNTFFTDSYFEENDPMGVFTMQKVYDVEIVLLDKAVSNDLGDVTRYTYKVGYKIMQNNGSFRDDLPSDTVIPLIFELLPEGDSFRINSISKIKYKK